MMERAIDFEASLKRLEHKHRELSSRLEQLREQRFLTDEEKLEEVKIKKMKLALKDQMEALVRRVGG